MRKFVGAVNIDISSSGFTDAIAELPPELPLVHRVKFRRWGVRSTRSAVSGHDHEGVHLRANSGLLQAADDSRPR